MILIFYIHFLSRKKSLKRGLDKGGKRDYETFGPDSVDMQEHLHSDISNGEVSNGQPDRNEKIPDEQDGE